MGPYANPQQPTRSPAVDTLRALVPDDADLIRVRAATPTAATGWAWTRAEVLGAYQWPPRSGEPLIRLGGADDGTHASLTLCEYLAAHRYAGNVRVEHANAVAYTFRIRLNIPRWYMEEDAEY